MAANFTKPAEELGAAFTAQTGDSVTFSFGATGALYTQISQGAPFEVFLAADNKRPALAVTEGFGVEGTVFTYAVGKLVLYAPTLDVTRWRGGARGRRVPASRDRRPQDGALWRCRAWRCSTSSG